MTPKDGPGVIDVLAVIISPVVCLLLTIVCFLGVISRRMWGGRQ
jgi:hypothetical protein